MNKNCLKRVIRENGVLNVLQSFSSSWMKIIAMFLLKTGVTSFILLFKDDFYFCYHSCYLNLQ